VLQLARNAQASIDLTQAKRDRSMVKEKRMVFFLKKNNQKLLSMHPS
jgi:hypothetical protein